MYEPKPELDWVEEMVQVLEAQEKAEKAEAQAQAQDPTPPTPREWTAEEIAQFQENTTNWCRARNYADKQKTEERVHRNRDPELRAAKEAMLRESLRAIQRHHQQQQQQ